MHGDLTPRTLEKKIQKLRAVGSIFVLGPGAQFQSAPSSPGVRVSASKMCMYAHVHVISICCCSEISSHGKAGVQPLFYDGVVIAVSSYAFIFT